MKIRALIAFIMCIIISVGFVLLFRYENQMLHKVNIDNLVDDANIIFSIETISEQRNRIAISGWAIRKGETEKYYNWVTGQGSGVYINTSIIIEDDNKTVYALNTFAISRSDLAQNINDGTNYEKPGIYGTVNRSVLKKNMDYKIGIMLINKDGKKTIMLSDKEIKG